MLAGTRLSSHAGGDRETHGNADHRARRAPHNDVGLGFRRKEVAAHVATNQRILRGDNVSRGGLKATTKQKMVRWGKQQTQTIAIANLGHVNVGNELVKELALRLGDLNASKMGSERNEG